MSTAFDAVTAPLEPGVTLVEASAGTGKTYSITVMAVRLILEGRARDIGRILVVTFTNAATDELITRLRSALREAVDAFAEESPAADPEQTWQRLRREMERKGHPRAECLARLREALSGIDRLSVSTIHSFCKRVLEESALETGTPYGAAFIEQADDLLDCAAEDWFRRTFYADGPLASFAVANGWTPASFLDDFRLWQRHPRTAILPAAVPLHDAVAALRDACRAALEAWDPVRVGAILDGITWKKGVALAFDARGQVTLAIEGLRRGELDGLATLESCSVAGIMDQANKTKKAALAAVPDEPFFAACDTLTRPAAGLTHAIRCACLCDVELGLEAQKQRCQALGFDDLLRRLHDAIAAEGAGGPLARAIRERFDAALIDEFQDTDPFQFPIFAAAFSGRPLFLIGDPKQAIYGFRGADIFAYADAVRGADRRYTLPRNWRSTEVLVNGLNGLFGRTERAFLRPTAEIGFRHAQAARPGRCPMDDRRAPLQWWFVPGGPDGGCGKGAARDMLRRRTSREIVALLEGCRVTDKDQLRPIRPGDIAVLVRSHREASEVQRELRAANVPSIVASTGDILESEEMAELERVLAAIVSPQKGETVRAALSTGLWGWSAERIRALSEEQGEVQWAELLGELERQREDWARGGFMRMMQGWLAAQDVPRRLLRLAGGQRRMTNVRHAIELLHAASEEGRLSPRALLAWIGRERARPLTEGDRRELRLESDADAVQIVTIHRSKGLEYGIVFCHCLWDAKEADGDAVVVHEDGGLVLDFGSPERDERSRRAASEQAAEELRLAYVALTRARWRCYAGWGVINGAEGSALGWLLRDDGTAAEDATCEDLLDAARMAMGGSTGAWLARLQDLVRAHPGLMECEVIADTAGLRRWMPPAAVPAPAPEPRAFRAHRQLVRLGMASFTSLTREQEHVADERDVADPALPAAAADGEPQAPAPIFAFAKGRRTGDLFHLVFEHADFQAPGTPAALERIEDCLARDPQVCRGLERAVAAQAIADMVRRTVESPLPGASFRLTDVPRIATLREWPFVLPLGAVTGRTLAAAFEEHAAAPPLRAYAGRLARLSRQSVQGFLTGVMDLAFTHEGRWYVADWKSNHLGDRPERYDDAAILAEMTGNHYVLQYHLYLLALHRYLTVRLPGYDYDAHVGGAWYAFVRGIDGTPGRGWWHDRPPRALIEALDAALVRPGMHAEAAR